MKKFIFALFFIYGCEYELQQCNECQTVKIISEEKKEDTDKDKKYCECKQEDKLF